MNQAATPTAPSHHAPHRSWVRRSLSRWRARGVRWTVQCARGLGRTQLPCRCVGRWTSVPAEYWSGWSFRYEPAVYRALRGQLSPGETFLDVGAHFGIWSQVASLIVGKEGRVVSFEPSPAVDKLRTFLKKTSAKIEAKAVGDSCGSIRFFAQGDALTGSLEREVTSINEAYNEGPVEELEVEMTTLDTYCAAEGITPSLIKVDVEGAELRVLTGARNLLETARPKLVIEVHPPQLAHFEGSESDLYQRLDELGYSVETIDQNTNSLYTILCLPQERPSEA